ncbi:von Willebrand factor type A domain-containing protein [Microdochium trichocladiopsis]|uniref:von Willebrand factor type A domain-containing protein n=1 Tax=Microdochium trichocladiopsis TaxID=1682393 RepID=A0A9P8XUZ5_9PEZI|nr:von Willebrand factor type A domain-containing protein [Microdochium trichocladiopsis]KAH7014292.1 von Willebrand factor type A domain-containing protein [Microdochium trichocladiopsis]
MRHYIHDTWQVCGLVYIDAAPPCLPHRLRQVGLEAHTTILSNAQRTTLKQTFITPSIWYRSIQNAPPPPPPPQQKYPEIRYQFPLHDGVSVVGFTATIHSSPKPRVIRGVVQEKAEARHTYTTAVAEGKAAGLLELIPEAADVFVTKLGNIPPATRVVVEVTYLGELKHDAQVDGLRLTIPMGVAPRFGSWPGDLVDVDVPVVRPQDFSGNDKGDGGLRITVDAQLPPSSQIQSVSSPSHQIAVSIGKTSKSASTDALSFNQASASLALTSLPASSSSLTTITTPFLEKDFILHLTASNLSTPQAVLERHPTIPNQHALMATLVPKFTLPSSTQRRKPEVVFVCDRSGSMGGKIPNLVSALRVFIKSLPQGVAFNIVSFGSRFSFLWKGQHGCSGSRAYSRESVAQAVSHVETFQADYGGTEMFWPLEAVFKEWQSTRDADVAADAAPRDLEVFLLTDGEVWNQAELLAMVERNVRESEGHIRVFSLGIGSGASTSLIEGVARVGNGFAQSVVDGEDMSGKVVRMVKGAMFEHVRDYRLEVKVDCVFRHDERDDDGEAAAAGQDLPL